MKKILHLSAQFDQPELVQNLVEKLAYRRYDIGFSQQQVPEGYKALETSTTEAYVSGTLSLHEADQELIRMPFITCFMFTCIKGKSDPYQLNWSCSLS